MTKNPKQGKSDSESDESKVKREQIEALEAGFKKFHARLGKHTRKRDDL